MFRETISTESVAHSCSKTCQQHGLFLISARSPSPRPPTSTPNLVGRKWFDLGGKRSLWKSNGWGTWSAAPAIWPCVFMLVSRVGDSDSRCFASWPSWCPMAALSSHHFCLRPQRQQADSILKKITTGAFYTLVKKKVNTTELLVKRRNFAPTTTAGRARQSRNRGSSDFFQAISAAFPYLSNQLTIISEKITNTNNTPVGTTQNYSFN